MPDIWEKLKRNQQYLGWNEYALVITMAFFEIDNACIRLESF